MFISADQIATYFASIEAGADHALTARSRLGRIDALKTRLLRLEPQAFAVTMQAFEALLQVQNPTKDSQDSKTHKAAQSLYEQASMQV